MRIFEMVSGSFFRTIGRILAYIAIGITIAYFAGFINIANVRASTTYDFEETFISVAFYPSGTSTINVDTLYYLNTQNPLYKVSLQGKVQSESKYGDMALDSGVYLIDVYIYGIEAKTGLTCSDISTNFGLYDGVAWQYGRDYIQSECLSVLDTDFKSFGAVRLLFKMQIGDYDDYSTISATDIVLNFQSANSFINPVSTGMTYGVSKITIYDYDNSIIESFKNDKSTSEIISSLNGVQSTINEMWGNINSNIDYMQEKQDETNGKLDDLNNNITNSDVDTSEASSFFGDFDDTDHGGISGIVTAPLRFINKLTGSCESLSFEIFDSDISLPCGDTLFWGREDVQDFRTTWNVLIGGVLIYTLLIKLFKVIHNLKDPDNSKIEVMDL